MTDATVALKPSNRRLDAIPRKRLGAYVAEIAHRRLTVVHAPAGFGKSTLLRQWRAALTDAGQQTAWFALDRTDDVTTQIVQALALDVPDFSPCLVPGHGSRGVPSIDVEVTSITRGLQRLNRPIFLFIDDIHRLSTDGLLIFERLIDRLPANAHLIVATREQTCLSLARLRAHGDLVELGMRELRFTVEETRQLLLPIELSDVELINLVDHMEGWVAGLRLALTCGHASTGSKLVIPFSTIMSPITDFFYEEVFTTQPRNIQDFLLHTSLLEQFPASLCALVTGISNSQEILQLVQSKGLFLSRSQNGEDPPWFRYHRLFAAFLARRLADHDPAAVKRIHITASKWLYDHDLVEDALKHAMKSKDQDWLGEVLETSCEELVNNGKLALVVELAEKLERPVLRRYPKVLLSIALQRIHSLQLKLARCAIDMSAERIEEMAAAGMTGGEDHALRSLLQHREMMLLAAEDNFPKVEELATALLQEAQDAKPYISCTLYSQIIRSQREQYKLSQFDRLKVKASRNLEQSRHKVACIAHQAIVGASLFQLGRTEAAESELRQALSLAGGNSALAALPALPLAAVLYDQNERMQAKALLGDHLPVARELASSDELLAGYRTIARLNFSEGDVAAAFQVLEDAREVALDLDLERMIVHVAAEKIRLLLRTGQIERAVETAQRQSLPDNYHALIPQISSTTTDGAIAATWVRLAVARGMNGDAMRLTQRWKQFSFHRGAIRHLIGWNLLQAQLHLNAGDKRAAQRSLREALMLAADGKNRRIFLDEGIRTNELLCETYGNGPITAQPVDRFASELIAALDGGPCAVGPRTPNDQALQDEGGANMTERELEILSCVASGMRNKEIGNRLGLTEGSVKWYMQRIYDKVGTRRRAIAVARARQLGFLE